MIPSVVMPDVVLWATGYLATALAARSEPYTADVYVGTKIPKERRSRMVIVRRDGGPRLDSLRESARLTINVWASTDQDANDLARMVRALLWAAPTGDPVVRVDDSAGPSPVPDESGQPRILLSVNVIVRGSNLN